MTSQLSLLLQTLEQCGCFRSPALHKYHIQLLSTAPNFTNKIEVLEIRKQDLLCNLSGLNTRFPHFGNKNSGGISKYGTRNCNQGNNRQCNKAYLPNVNESDCRTHDEAAHTVHNLPYLQTQFKANSRHLLHKVIIAMQSLGEFNHQ